MTSPEQRIKEYGRSLGFDVVVSPRPNRFPAMSRRPSSAYATV